MNVGDSIALTHLDRMTDSTGSIQHAIQVSPVARAATRPTTTLGLCAFALVYGIGTPQSGCCSG